MDPSEKSNPKSKWTECMACYSIFGLWFNHLSKVLNFSTCKEMRGDKKGDEIEQKGNLRMICGSFYRAKDDDSKPEGDDSHFICEERQTIGLADGVGGWTKRGVDAGLYARELINNSLLATLTRPLTRVNPLVILCEAFWRTRAQGSSTACIITLHEDNMLHAVNVGDSGFMVIRKGKEIYTSPIQQHSFNYPYQLGNSPRSDKPWQAEIIRVKVEAGDVIIAGTDGLFDNMWKSEILKATAKGIEKGLHPEKIAGDLARKAYVISMSMKVEAPFMKASVLAQRYHEGGKPDDITVVVSRILRT